MTDRSDFKRLVRRRMLDTGEPYTVARSHFSVIGNEATPLEGKTDGAQVTVASFKRKVYGRKRIKDLPAHLQERYGFTSSQITRLDVGVYRADRIGAPSWIVRVFSSERPVESAHGDAEILKYLEGLGFPAERVANSDPVSELAGQPVLVTEYLPGETRRDKENEEVMRELGGMMGKLHSLPQGSGARKRDAGGWHHLSVDGGGRRRDIETLLDLIQDAATRVDRKDRSLLSQLVAEIEQLDDLDDLPKALIHPDPCSANLIGTHEEVGVLIDWTGAGKGPRLISLANMISAATTMALVDEAVSGYRAHVLLEARELDRLEGALLGFPLILDCWMYLFHGAPLDLLLNRLAKHKERAIVIAERARAAFGSSPPLIEKAAHISDAQERLF